ncbi:MAG: S16 family serine protease [Thermodesulfobacteriota bacterium]|nr:S16 family serine protease [Thermodesulfobacteriota bacterium]
MDDFRENDYRWVEELLQYPQNLEKQIDFFDETSEISLPEDPIEKVIFQDRAKAAIRKVAQNKGHILMVGRPGTGKSLLAGMFKDVIDRSLGEYIRHKEAIVAFPGKDRNHIRFAYETPETINKAIGKVNEAIERAQNSVEEFSLADQIRSVKRVKTALLWITGTTALAGCFFPPAFIATGLSGMGAVFMYLQENNHRAQEKIHRETHNRKLNVGKNLRDMIPVVLHDPQKDKELMSRISEPNARNMKGGFRHDPYQSGNLHTPAHLRAYLGAHARSPIIYIDELKTLVKAGYMSDMLEIMQEKKYILEGGIDTGSGGADRSENHLKAENIILACCNHDTLEYLQKEGDGAFLSRIEDKGEIVQMESAVSENLESIKQSVQYVKQEIDHLGQEISQTWAEVFEQEGYRGAKKRSELIFGKKLPEGYLLEAREFSRGAVLEIIKELRCRASDRKLSAILRPINGIIKTAEYNAILENASFVEAEHVKKALKEHQSLEGALALELIESKKDLKKYIDSVTDSIGYVVGLAVIHSNSSGRMYGQPLPIHCQINAGGADSVTAPGKTGEIAKAAAENVRASIKKIFKKIRAPYVGYEMHIQYIQAHGGVEGDSASVAMDIGLISDYIKQPVTQKYGVTGSLTGDIVLAVGGVTEKIRSIMDPLLGMAGACIPWQNKYDLEPLLINVESEYITKGEIPGIRIYRSEHKQDPFDVYLCKTKYHAYKILMGADRDEVEARMAERSRKDMEFLKNVNVLREIPRH